MSRPVRPVSSSHPLPLQTLLVWLFLSSLYYAETLFSGEFVLDFNEGFTQKFAKYIVCAVFSGFFLLKSRSVGTAAYTVLMTALLTAHLWAGGPPNIFAVSILTLVTMCGLTGLLDAYPHATRAIARTIVWSGALVGSLSIVELTILAEKFVGYWAATGGVRSISTLFNPNNLGMYLGAALLLMPWAELGRRTNLLLFIPLTFGFAASGSRTAWVALAACVVVLLLSRSKAARVLRRELAHYRMAIAMLLIVAALAVLGVRSLLEGTGIESENRGTDLYTASIRWINFVAYLDRIDFQSLLPDLLDERADLIQDNVYLVIFNILGGFGVFISAVLLVVFTRGQRKVPKEDRSAWSLLVTYFLLSGLSGSFLNSFPNNQLFFIAVGGLLAPRFTWGRTVTPRMPPPCTTDGRFPNRQGRTAHV